MECLAIFEHLTRILRQKLLVYDSSHRCLVHQRPSLAATHVHAILLLELEQLFVVLFREVNALGAQVFMLQQGGIIPRRSLPRQGRRGGDRDETAASCFPRDLVRRLRPRCVQAPQLPVVVLAEFRRVRLLRTSQHGDVNEFERGDNFFLRIK